MRASFWSGKISITSLSDGIIFSNAVETGHYLIEEWVIVTETANENGDTLHDKMTAIQSGKDSDIIRRAVHTMDELCNTYEKELIGDVTLPSPDDVPF